MIRPKTPRSDPTARFPPLPINRELWRSVVEAVGLPPQQARIVELVLRGMCDKQIAATLGIAEPTLRTYLSRIFARTGTRGRMELALHVLGVSHAIRDQKCRCSR